MAVTHRALLAVVVATGVVALVAMAALWPRSERFVEPPSSVQSTQLLDATLLRVQEVAGADAVGLPPGAVTVDVTARVEATGEEVSFETTDDTGASYTAGQKVRLAAIEQEGLPTTYFISDFRRTAPMVVLLALFLAAVVGFGRLHGLRAILGLVLTFMVMLWFIVPAILAGRNPLAVAVAGSVVIMIVTLYLSHGFTAKSTAAVVGTTGALLITGVLAIAFVEAANLTGFSSEEARLANASLGGVSLRGLLLAGIIIGGLGVLDDVTMAQSSTVFELHRADPTAGFARLISGALSVGRDHIAATVNTLFLAYAGASLPLLILFATGSDPFATVVTSEVVAVEVVRTLVGSIGLIAAVPLTTALAAAMVAGGTGPGREPGTGASRGERPPATTAGDLGQAGDDDPEWEARLRDAYRLPPERH